MKLVRHALMLAASLLPATLGRATTITYNLLASTSAGNLTGTVTINSATDQVTSANLTLSDSALGTPVFSTVSSSAAYNGLSQDYIAGSSSSWLNYGGQVALFFDTANVSTGNLSICTAAAICGTQGTEQSFVQIYSTLGNITFDLTSGALTPTTTSTSVSTTGLTPEPSSLALLGTGILGIAGVSLLLPLKTSLLAEPPQPTDQA